METLTSQTETKLIARAWVLEGGADCDGTYTRGMVIPCADLMDADIHMFECDKWSDGNYYKITEKWSDVVDYCNNYFMDIEDFIYAAQKL